jgi:hypothetical protein
MHPNKEIVVEDIEGDLIEEQRRRFPTGHSLNKMSI